MARKPSYILSVRVSPQTRDEDAVIDQWYRQAQRQGDNASEIIRSLLLRHIRGEDVPQEIAVAEVRRIVEETLQRYQPGPANTAEVVAPLAQPPQEDELDLEVDFTDVQMVEIGTERQNKAIDEVTARAMQAIDEIFRMTG